MISTLFSLEYVFPNSAAYIAAMHDSLVVRVHGNKCLYSVSFVLRFTIMSSITRHFQKNSVYRVINLKWQKVVSFNEMNFLAKFQPFLKNKVRSENAIKFQQIKIESSVLVYFFLKL